MSNDRWSDIGRLVLRCTIGGLMLFHGIAKIVHGVGPIASRIQSKGLPPATAYAVYIGELIAPILVVLGVFTRPAAVIIAIDMGIATWLVHMGDLLQRSRTGGWAVELEALYLFGALAIAFLGGGRYAPKGGSGRFN